MVSLIGGVIAVVLGIVGIVNWWSQFIIVLKGMLPALFILCGAVAVGAGFGSLKDKMKSAKEEKEEAPKPEPAQEEKKEETKEG